MPLEPEPFTFESWRHAVRPMLATRRRPDDLPWREYLSTEAADAASSTAHTLPSDPVDIRLPRSLMALLERLACFRTDGRWELMYRLAWRTLFENPHLLTDLADVDVSRAIAMDRAVKRDMHKMHAFVRFREVAMEGEASSYFAWFEPKHEILRKAASFFVKRDEEDLGGAPFVGPAGKVLDEALRAAALDRSEIYLTNAVKHFKWEPRGKRRLHKRPSVAEIRACNGWLQIEISNVKPLVIVALGASALLALTGSASTVAAARARQMTHAEGARILATYHPSAILRADERGGDKLRDLLIQDLKLAGRWIVMAQNTRKPGQPIQGAADQAPSGPLT